MIRIPCAILIAGMPVTQALAVPCVSPTFDVPFPGATDVTSHVSDLPSSTFPAFWQEGRLEGFAYKIFANGTGLLRSGPEDQLWRIDVICNPGAEDCTVAQTGASPEAALQVAKRIGQCFIPTWRKDDTQQTQTQTVVEPNDDVQDNETLTVAPASECGLDLGQEATEVATMQRLLTLLGEDPGPVDGFLGPKTFAAMAAFVDDPGWGTAIPNVIKDLAEQHCAQAQ